MATKYISNEFDPTLIKKKIQNFRVKEITISEAREFVIDTLSLIKHKEFCDLYSRIFNVDFKINDCSIELKEGDIILVGDIQTGKTILSDEGYFFKEYPDFITIDEKQIKWYITILE